MRVTEEISDDKGDLKGCSRGIGEMMNGLWRVESACGIGKGCVLKEVA